jgi:3-phenylpropionate/cinnamic acid dioxygenase small subunit
MGASNAGQAPSAELRFEVHDLYASYAEAINDNRLEDWPDFFAEGCEYRVLSRENAERSLPLAIVRAESRAMLEDRVVAIRKAMTFSPHYWHHIISGIRILTADDDGIGVRANYSITRTMPDRLSELFQVGQYRDRLVRSTDRLLFKEKICIYDSVLIPNSLVFPV